VDNVNNVSVVSTMYLQSEKEIQPITFQPD
jgi:hypothetical protein